MQALRNLLTNPINLPISPILLLFISLQSNLDDRAWLRVLGEQVVWELHEIVIEVDQGCGGFLDVSYAELEVFCALFLHWGIIIFKCLIKIHGIYNSIVQIMNELAEKSVESEQQESASSLNKPDNLVANQDHQLIRLLHDSHLSKISQLRQFYKQNLELYLSQMGKIIESFEKLDLSKKKMIEEKLQTHQITAKKYLNQLKGGNQDQFNFDVWQFYQRLSLKLRINQVIDGNIQVNQINQQEPANSSWKQKGIHILESIYDGSTCQGLTSGPLALLSGLSIYAEVQFLQYIFIGITILYFIIGVIFYWKKKKQNRGRVINMSERIAPI